MATLKRLMIDAEVVRHKINSFAASVIYRGNAEMFNGKDSCNPHEYTRGYERGIMDAQKIVCGQPTVDAVEVVHGRWIDKTEVIVKPPFPPLESARVDCSVCGHIFWHTSALTYNYCPNCGAKMDGDGNGSA